MLQTIQTPTQTGDLTTQLLESIAAKLSGHTTAPIYAAAVRAALESALAETVGEQCGTVWATWEKGRLGVRVIAWGER